MRYTRVRHVDVPVTEEQIDALLATLNDDERTVLATYNAERSRGIVHDAEWQADMANLQAIFDADQIRKLEAQGYVLVPVEGGGQLWRGPART